MKLLPLTKGLFAKVDDEDFDKCLRFKFYPVKSGKTFYADAHDFSIKPKGKIRLHWLVFGKPKQGFVIDHIDGDGLNNQKSNLRLATIAQNSCNKRAKGISKYRGVKYSKQNNKWIAEVKTTYLGSFNTEEEAAIVYNIEAKKRYGEFARLNMIMK